VMGPASSGFSLFRGLRREPGGRHGFFFDASKQSLARRRENRYNLEGLLQA